MPVTLTTQTVATPGLFWIKVLEILGGSSSDVGQAALYADGAPYITAYAEDPTLSFLGAKYDINGNLVWAREIGGSNSQRPTSGAVDTSGNLFIGGWNDQGSGTARTMLVKYDSSGAFQWQRALTEGGVRDQYIYGVDADDSGNSYITGTREITGSSASAVLLAKYNSAGTLQWQRMLGGDASGEEEQGRAITVKDGNIYITGEVDENAENLSHDILVTKYADSGSPTPSIQWQRDIGDSGVTTEGTGIAVDNSGNVFVVGYNSFFSRVYVLKLNGTTGAIIAQRQINGAQTPSCALDNSGNLYVVCNGSNVYILKYNNNLVLQWQNQIDYTCGAQFQLLGVATNGTNTIYATGYIDNQSDTVSSNTDDIVIASLPADGSGLTTCGPFDYQAASLTEIAGTLGEKDSLLTDRVAGLSNEVISFTSSTPSEAEHDCSTLNCDGGAPPT